MQSISPATLPVHFSGTGPGPQSADGCSVELYRRSAYAGEIELLKPWLPPGTTVLELGCGTGRLTHRLVEFGCRVTGVDNSADMLRHVGDAVQRVQADIETLQLDQRFDVVLLRCATASGPIPGRMRSASLHWTRLPSPDCFRPKASRPPEALDADRLWFSARPRSLQGFLATHQP